MLSEYFLGVDLGCASDFTAISLLERKQTITGSPAKPGTWDHEFSPRQIKTEYHIRLMERPELQTPYTSIVERIKALMSNPDLIDRCSLIVDATGVGKPVIDMLNKADMRPVSILITGGATVGQGYFTYSVPKRELISIVHLTAQSGRLVSADLPLADAFRKEMENFKVKIRKGGYEAFEAWRESDHDDIVLSVAIALWYAARNDPDQEVVHRGKLNDQVGSAADYDPLHRDNDRLGQIRRQRQDMGLDYGAYDPLGRPEGSR